MTVDDTMVVGCIAALGGSVAFLWKTMDSRYKSELSKRDADIKDLIHRVRKLEDERLPTQIAHTKEIKEITSKYEETSVQVARSLADIAKTMRDIMRALVPHPTKASDETDVLVRK